MIKINESKFIDIHNDDMKFIENKELIDDLQNVLNSESKKISSNAKTGLQFDLLDDKNILRKFSTYSKTNKELYFLIKTKSDLNFSYSLITFSLETNNLKSHKYLKFCFGQSSKKHIDPSSDFLNFDIKEIFIHPKNQNQICLFGEEFLGFISDLKEFTKSHNPRENLSLIKILHTSLFERELKTIGNNSNDKNKNYFKKFKFSNFSNYFGVLLKDNTFRFYNINSGITESLFDFSNTKSEEIVDFAFPPHSNFSWQIFSIVFLDICGSIYYVCPIFPENFEVEEEILIQMNKFQKNLRVIDDSQENLLNENIVNHLERSAVYQGEDLGAEFINSNSSNQAKLSVRNYLSKKVNKVEIKIDEYLKNFNRNLIPLNLTTIDKRRQEEVLHESSTKQSVCFTQVHIVNSSPLTILRVSQNNSIDVIICSEEITPNRKHENKFSISDRLEVKESLCFLVESIRFDLYDAGKNSENIPNMRIYHNENYSQAEFPLKEKISITVNILNDIYVVEFAYLERLSFYFQKYNGKEDLQVGELKSLVREISSFDYDNYFEALDQRKKSKVISRLPFGYYCLEKIGNRFLLISVLSVSKNSNSMSISHLNSQSLDTKFFVREIDSLHYMSLVQNSSNVEDSQKNQFSENLNEFIEAFQNNLEKFETSFKTQKNSHLDLGKIESMMNKTYYFYFI